MLLVGTMIGIQFMVASAEDKAKVKEALVPYVIGCAVIFGAFTIWSIAVNLGQDITSGSGSSLSETGKGTLSNPETDFNSRRKWWTLYKINKISFLTFSN